MTDVIADPNKIEVMPVPEWVGRDGLETMLVHVTDTHIEIGQRGEPSACMIAVTFADNVHVTPGCTNAHCEIQDTRVCGHPGTIEVYNPLSIEADECWHFSTEVCILVQDWDLGKYVEPFSFMAWKEPS